MLTLHALFENIVDVASRSRERRCSANTRAFVLRFLSKNSCDTINQPAENITFLTMYDFDTIINLFISDYFCLFDKLRGRRMNVNTKYIKQIIDALLD